MTVGFRRLLEYTNTHTYTSRAKVNTQPEKQLQA